MEKVNFKNYNIAYFHGGNKSFKPVMYNDKVVKWYHTYLLKAILDRMEVNICKHFY